MRRVHTPRPILATLLLSVLFASSASVAFSQDAAGATPPNAHARPYGTGWQCDFGYRETNASCLVIQAPANAHVAEFSLGRGWECDRGYRETGSACAKVAVPANAYLTRLIPGTPRLGVRPGISRGWRNLLTGQRAGERLFGGLRLWPGLGMRSRVPSGPGNLRCHSRADECLSPRCGKPLEMRSRFPTKRLRVHAYRYPSRCIS